MPPAPDPNQLEQLKQQHHLERWRNRNRLDERLFIRGFHLHGAEFDGWHPRRIQPVRLPGFPPHIHATYTSTTAVRQGPSFLPSAGTMPAAFSRNVSEPLLQTDSFECDSRGGAHEFLIRILAEFQLPGIAMEKDARNADVLFTVPGRQVVVFARANLVFLLRNTGPGQAPVSDLAAQLDTSLIQRPAPPAPTAARSSRAAAPAPIHVKVGSVVPLSVEPTAAPIPLSRAAATTIAPPGSTPFPSGASGQMIKIFSHRGDVRSEGDQLFYQPDTTGVENVDVFVVTPSAGATFHRLRYKID